MFKCRNRFYSVPYPISISTRWIPKVLLESLQSNCLHRKLIYAYNIEVKWRHFSWVLLRCKMVLCVIDVCKQQISTTSTNFDYANFSAVFPEICPSFSGFSHLFFFFLLFVCFLWKYVAFFRYARRPGFISKVNAKEQP